MNEVYTCNFRNGLTMAQYRSADRAVKVKTDTPMDTSFADSVMRHNNAPHGHDSSVYTIEANGTHIKITSKSANASENMYLKINVNITTLIMFMMIMLQKCYC